MSQKEFGEYFGFSRETIAKIERGDQRIYWDLIVPIAIFGNISLDELAERTDLQRDSEFIGVMDPEGDYGIKNPQLLVKNLVEEEDRNKRQQLVGQLMHVIAGLQNEIVSLKDELLTLFRKLK